MCRTHYIIATHAVPFLGDLGEDFVVDTSIAQPFTIFTSCDRCAVQFMSDCDYETLPEVLTRAIRDPPSPDVCDVRYGLQRVVAAMLLTDITLPTATVPACVMCVAVFRTEGEKRCGEIKRFRN
jgi:hypothetical protein